MTLSIRATFWTRILGCVFLAGWLAGCSATQLFNEGMSDINAGRLDVGLAKMEDAVKKDPDSSFLKTQLRMTRKYVVQRELQEADAARAASDFTGARRLYEHVLELDKANVQALAGLESTKNAEMNQLEIRMAKDLIGHNEIKEAQAHRSETDAGPYSLAKPASRAGQAEAALERGSNRRVAVPRVSAGHGLRGALAHQRHQFRAR
jgi:tetratricopeptide (TPR) repeat protein